MYSSSKCVNLTPNRIIKHLKVGNRYCQASIKSFEEIPKLKPISKLKILKSLINIRGKHRDDFHREPYFEKLYYKYGPIVSDGNKNRGIVHLFDPKDLQTLLLNESEHPVRTYNDPLQLYRKRFNNKPLANNSIFAENGSEWYRLRSHINDLILKPKSADNYYPTFNSVAVTFVNNIPHLLNDDNVIDDLMQQAYNWSLENVYQLLFGQPLGALDPCLKNKNPDAEKILNTISILFHQMYKLVIDIPWYKKFNTPTFMKMGEEYKHLNGEVSRHLDFTIQKIEESSKITDEAKNNLTFLLLHKNVDKEDVFSIATDFFFAGIDTTAAMAAMVIYNLSKNHRVQNQLFQEIQTVSTNSNEEIDVDKIHYMSYLHACIKESLRLTPVVDITSRVLEKEQVFSGYRVPANTRVLINHRALSKLHFDKADEFIPERWLKSDSNNQMPQPFSWLPFGHGIRMCVGRRLAEMATKILIIKILQTYELSNDVNHQVKMLSGLFNRPNKPLNVQFRLR